VHRYNGPANDWDQATALGVSPDGSMVFVTGKSTGSTGYPDYETVAYETSTGHRLWVRRYMGPGDSSLDTATALAVSPGGSMVFVTGGSAVDYATVAYDAFTGDRLWVRRHSGPGYYDVATALGVSPDGSMVFVTGESSGEYETIAYDASTGHRLWASRYGSPGYNEDVATALAVSPDGSTVFVTGCSSQSDGGVFDYATVAYEASTGHRLWVRRYNGPANGYDIPVALGVSPNGSMVFVTGTSDAPWNTEHYATIAYDASTGDRLWLKRYKGPADSYDEAAALGVSPDGSSVFVTGVSGSIFAPDYATVAYDASTGHRLWVRRYNGPANDYDEATALGVSPDGYTVFVTGFSTVRRADGDYATVAYDAATGARLWLRRYDGPGNGYDAATALGVSPDGSRVFVTGNSFGSGSGSDYATVAYSPT